MSRLAAHAHDDVHRGRQRSRRPRSRHPAHPQSCTREDRPQPRQQSREDPDRPTAAGIAGAQHIGEQVLLGLLVKAQEPVGSRSIVIRLTLRFRRLRRRSITVSASAISIRYQIRPIKGVLKVRQRRLRSEVLATDRVATTQQLLDRIDRETARIVVIRVAAGNRIQLLPHQITDRMARWGLLFFTTSNRFANNVG